MGINDICIDLAAVPINGFMPGTNILGKVLLKVDKRKHMKDLNITLQGKATVKFHTHHIKWFNHQNRTNEGIGFPSISSLNLLNGIQFVRRLTDSSFFKAEQYFANIFHSLIVNGHLEHGDNVIPFCLPLMENLPPSFVCEDGSIRYKLKVRKKHHTLFKTEFRVANRESCKPTVQLDPALNRPIKYTESMDFPQFFATKKMISFSLSLPKSHFYAEEKFNVALEINNTLSVKVTSVAVSLGTVILCAGKYKSHKNVKMQHDIISEISCGELNQGEQKSWTLPFLVPGGSVSNLDCCAIIRVYNVICVTIKPDCVFSDLRSFHFYAPIKISPLPEPTASRRQLNTATTSSSSIPPPNIGFVFQRSVPSSAPPYPDDSDPPPPYPGTPTAMADEINRLRLS